MGTKIDNHVIVVAGTTYSKISRETGIPTKTLEIINKTPANRLQLGQKISLDYIVQPNDNFIRIGKKIGIDHKLLQKWNPDIEERKMQIGQHIRLTPPDGEQREYSPEALYNTVRTAQPAAVTNPVKAQAKPVSPIIQVNKPQVVAKPTATNTNPSLEEYAKRQPAEYKPLVDFLKKEEKVVPETYIGPDGHAHVGVGHKLTTQPAFITKIANSNSSKDFKAKLAEALKDPKNRIVLAEALEADIKAAIKKTGIKGISAKVDTNTLRLTDEQIQVLLNADIETARETAHRRIGKAAFDRSQTHEKMVALDLFFNSGNNSPKFCEAFRQGNMKEAQYQLDIFHSKKINPKTKKEISRTYFLGLIKRNYKRMNMLRQGDITPEAKNKLVEALNKYLRQKGKATISNFKEAEAILIQP